VFSAQFPAAVVQSRFYAGCGSVTLEMATGTSKFTSLFIKGVLTYSNTSGSQRKPSQSCSCLDEALAAAAQYAAQATPFSPSLVSYLTISMSPRPA
jgi:hypothetical protein